MADGRSAILMIAPQRPDGPPVRAGKPYSAIARLAESVHAFVAMDRGLRAIGFSAPKIHEQDLETGLLLIEDLGSGVVVGETGPIAERYEAAALLLADMHRHHLPTILPVSEGRDHVVPDYDLDAMEIETELLLDWYAPHIGGLTLPAVARSGFRKAFRPLLEAAIAGERSWVLRDYHSPNLIWLPQREGLARVGVIDFQDAVLGPTAYDLVSLGQDARVTVSPELELHLIAAYATARRQQNAGFDPAAFARLYAIMGAQRATKILGIFARLDKRDGKPAYLRHLPRVEDYLRRNLAHPDLAELANWYRSYLPGLLAESA
jgi:N-acetylmuramate 1-kinase